VSKRERENAPDARRRGKMGNDQDETGNIVVLVAHPGEALQFGDVAPNPLGGKRFLKSEKKYVSTDEKGMKGDLPTMIGPSGAHR